MKRLKYVYVYVCFFISIVLMVICFEKANSRNNCVYEYVFGQADIEYINKYDIANIRNHNSVGRRSIYIGSINIIEKYLTIYMILYILRYYVSSRKIIR